MRGPRGWARMEFTPAREAALAAQGRVVMLRGECGIAGS
jgi:hypothetical protein